MVYSRATADRRMVSATTKSEAKTINQDLDDDDSEDSDYCPENDKDADKEDDAPEETKLSTISFGRKRKVDDLWATMQEETAGSKKSISRSSSSSSSSSSKSGKKKTSNKKNSDILAAIFGKKQSQKIVSGVSSTNADKAGDLKIKEAARESVKMLQKKTTVTETRKFAGQSIT